MLGLGKENNGLDKLVRKLNLRTQLKLISSTYQLENSDLLIQPIVHNIFQQIKRNSAISQYYIMEFSEIELIT